MFSISPSEICDERTASQLGWFNAVRRSSIRPEHLIDSARLYDYWVNGFGEGEYTHKAHVHLSAVDESSSEATPLHYSAPSLMDLLNEENVTPKDVGISILEETLFNHPDPYDLAKCDRVDPALSAPATVVRSQDCFDIAQYVKLDSPSLATLITHMSDGRPISVADAAPVASGSKGKLVDWTMDDYF